MVPAVKPAAASSQTRMIGLLGTLTTVASPYTRTLIAEFAGDCGVVTRGAPELVEAAERMIQGLPVDDAVIRAVLDRMFGAAGGDRIDTVVLGCTHFPLLTPAIGRGRAASCRLDGLRGGRSPAGSIRFWGRAQARAQE